MVSKCRGIAEIAAVMEMAQEVGVTTRARAASAMGATTIAPATSSAKRTRKRRKIINNNDDDEQRLELFSASSSIDRRRRRSRADDDVIQPEAEDELTVSCCSSNESVEERIEFVDLEIESARGETSTCISGDERREMNPSSEFRLNSEDAEPLTEANTNRISVTQKMPSELELEEFFVAAEKDIQKRFAEKYNYDVVKDVPLEGRYQWVQIKP